MLFYVGENWQWRSNFFHKNLISFQPNHLVLLQFKFKFKQKLILSAQLWHYLYISYDIISSILHVSLNIYEGTLAYPLEVIK